MPHDPHTQAVIEAARAVAALSFLEFPETKRLAEAVQAFDADPLRLEIFLDYIGTAKGRDKLARSMLVPARGRAWGFDHPLTAAESSSLATGHAWARGALDAVRLLEQTVTVQFINEVLDGLADRLREMPPEADAAAPCQHRWLLTGHRDHPNEPTHMVVFAKCDRCGEQLDGEARRADWDGVPTLVIRKVRV